MSSFLNRIGAGNRGPAPKRSPSVGPNDGYDPHSQSYHSSAGPATGPNGRPLYLCQPFVKAALVKGSFKTITACPKLVDVNEWVAVGLVDFFHNINLVVGMISEECTLQNCPTMSAGPGMDYTWSGKDKSKQVKVPAPQYIDYVMTWASKLIDDESLFPTKAGREFSHQFPPTARHLFTQLLRTLVHIYHAHYSLILHLSLEAHVNSLFAHFLTFGRTFDLLDPKECRAPKEGVGFVVGDLLDAWKSMGIIDPAL